MQAGCRDVQTISVPYGCQDEAREQIAAPRRVYGSAVRTAYANAIGADGKPLEQKGLRHLVKTASPAPCAPDHGSRKEIEDCEPFCTDRRSLDG
jgi:hypothetical protein